MLKFISILFFTSVFLVGCQVEVEVADTADTTDSETTTDTSTSNDNASDNQGDDETDQNDGGSSGDDVIQLPPDETGTDVVTDTDTQDETNTDTSDDTDTASDDATETSTSDTTETDTSSTTNTDSSTETDDSADTSTDDNTATETETDTSSETDGAVDSDTGEDTNTQTETDTSSETDDAADTDTGEDTNTQTETETDTSSETDDSADTDTGEDTSTQTETGSDTSTDTQVSTTTKLVAASASWSDGDYVPSKAVDGSTDEESRWSSNSGDARGSWIMFELESSIEITEVSMAFFKGDVRVSYFKILTSDDGTNWTEVFNGQSSGSSLEMESFNTTPTVAKYLKVEGLGNSSNQWNSYTEVRIKNVDYQNGLTTETETETDTDSTTDTDSETDTATETDTGSETTTDTNTETSTETETTTSTDTSADLEPVGDFAIDELSGSLQPGDLVVISGQGFGDFGPKYLFVSDFDQESVSEEDPITANNSQAGAVSYAAGSLSLRKARSGTQSVLATEGNAEAYIPGSNVFSAKDFNEYFVSFHKYDDTNSGASTRDIDRLAGTRKDVWVMRGNRGDNPSSGGSGSGNDLYLRHNGISGNSTDQHWYPSLHDPKNVWVNWQYWVRSNPSKPYSQTEAMASSFVAGQVGQQANAHNDGLFSDLTSNDTPAYWDRIKIGGYLRNLPVYHDDYYVAIGDHGETANAAARVEFFNSHKYEEATARSFCLIETWSDDSVTCRPNVGDLDWDSGPIYCVIFNGDNKRSKEFDCKNNQVMNRRLAYMSFSDSDDISYFKDSFAVNDLSSASSGYQMNEVLDIQGDALPISIQFEEINISSGWNSLPQLTHVSLPDLLMKNNVKVTGDGIIAKVSGLPVGAEVTVRLGGAYYRGGDYYTEVTLNSQSASHNSESKGIHEPVMLTDTVDENGEATILIKPDSGDGSYISWFSIEY